jgi:hypothetical protein
MNPNETPPLIMAFDARRAIFGYALFEGPMRLLDWGRGAIAASATSDTALITGSKHIGRILDLCHPDMIVVRYAPSGQTSREGDGSTFKAILREAATRQIPVNALSRDEVRVALQVRREISKHEINCLLAELFPELRPRLPPKRRVWQSERRVTAMFDAVATGVAYWVSRGELLLPPQ